MPSKSWCPHCSHPNLYETERPRFCGKCSQDMTTAFKAPALTSPKPPTMTTAHAREEIEEPAAPLRRPKPLYGSYEGDSRSDDDDDERYSKDRMQARASQLASRFAGAFNFSVESGTTIKAGSILAPIEAQIKGEAAAPAKKTRKKS